MLLSFATLLLQTLSQQTRTLEGSHEIPTLKSQTGSNVPAHEEFSSVGGIFLLSTSIPLSVHHYLAFKMGASISLLGLQGPICSLYNNRAVCRHTP